MPIDSLYRQYALQQFYICRLGHFYFRTCKRDNGGYDDDILM